MLLWCAMKTFFWICLSLLVPGLLLRLDVGGSGILATDILLPIFAFFWLFKKIVLDRSIPSASFLIPGFVFLFWAGFSFLLGAWDLGLKESVLSGAYLVRFFSLLIWAWAVVDLFSDEEGPRVLTGLFKIVGLVVGLGYLQFYFFPDISDFSQEGGWDPHTGRLLGTWMDPNFVAGLLGFMLPVMIGRGYEVLREQDESKGRACFWIGSLIFFCLGALFLTFSRSGYLAAGIGLGWFFLWRDPKVILLGVGIAILGLVSNERAQKRVGELAGTLAAIVMRDTDEIDPTASLRLESWRKSFELYQKYPVAGIGFNTYRYRAAEEGIVDESYFSAGGSDSSLLTVLVTTGTVGFLIYLWFWGGIWRRSFWLYWKQKKSGGELSLGLSSGIMALLVHSFFVNSLLFPLMVMAVFVVAGVVLSKE